MRMFETFLGCIFLPYTSPTLRYLKWLSNLNFNTRKKQDGHFVRIGVMGRGRWFGQCLKENVFSSNDLFLRDYWRSIFLPFFAHFSPPIHSIWLFGQIVLFCRQHRVISVSPQLVPMIATTTPTIAVVAIVLRGSLSPVPLIQQLGLASGRSWTQTYVPHMAVAKKVS